MNSESEADWLEVSFEANPVISNIIIKLFFRTKFFKREVADLLGQLFDRGSISDKFSGVCLCYRGPIDAKLFVELIAIGFDFFRTHKSSAYKRSRECVGVEKAGRHAENVERCQF